MKMLNYSKNVLLLLLLCLGFTSCDKDNDESEKQPQNVSFTQLRDYIDKQSYNWFSIFQSESEILQRATLLQEVFSVSKIAFDKCQDPNVKKFGAVLEEVVLKNDFSHIRVINSFSSVNITINQRDSSAWIYPDYESTPGFKFYRITYYKNDETKVETYISVDYNDRQQDPQSVDPYIILSAIPNEITLSVSMWPADEPNNKISILDVIFSPVIDTEKSTSAQEITVNFPNFRHLYHYEHTDNRKTNTSFEYTASGNKMFSFASVTNGKYLFDGKYGMIPSDSLKYSSSASTFSILNSLAISSDMKNMEKYQTLNLNTLKIMLRILKDHILTVDELKLLCPGVEDPVAYLNENNAIRIFIQNPETQALCLAPSARIELEADSNNQIAVQIICNDGTSGNIMELKLLGIDLSLMIATLEKFLGTFNLIDLDTLLL